MTSEHEKSGADNNYAQLVRLIGIVATLIITVLTAILSFLNWISARFEYIESRLEAKADIQLSAHRWTSLQMDEYKISQENRNKAQDDALHAHLRDRDQRWKDHIRHLEQRLRNLEKDRHLCP